MPGITHIHNVTYTYILYIEYTQSENLSSDVPVDLQKNVLCNINMHFLYKNFTWTQEFHKLCMEQVLRGKVMHSCEKQTF